MNKKGEVIKKIRECGFIERDIEYLKNKIKILDNRILKVRTSKINYEFNNRYNRGLEDLIDIKIDLELKLNNKYLDQMKINKDLNILDKDEQKILIDFYFKKYSVYKIAIDSMDSEAQIRRKKEKALNELVEFMCL